MVIIYSIYSIYSGYLLESSGDVVEHRVTMTTDTTLIEYHQTFQTLVLIFLMHVLFRHELLKLSTRHIHVHCTPSKIMLTVTLLGILCTTQETSIVTRPMFVFLQNKTSRGRVTRLARDCVAV
mgnify:FL=1